MDFFLYCIILGWLFIIMINYKIHIKVLFRIKKELFHILAGQEPLKNRRHDLFERRHKDIKENLHHRIYVDRRKLNFSLEYSKKEDFRRFLNIGVVIYSILSIIQSIFILIVIFLLSYFLEYFHFPVFGNESFDLESNWPLFLGALIFLIYYIYLKIKSFNKIIDEYKYSKH